MLPKVLQDTLQKWESGVKSGVWIRPSVVASCCTSIEEDDFSGYMKGSAGMSVLDQGFHVFELRRKVELIFIFNRGACRRTGDVPVPPNTVLWRKLMSV